MRTLSAAGSCDNCVAPPSTWDATEGARKALSAIYRTGQRFGAVHLIDVLRGRATERISKWEHDKLSVFGIGANLDDPAWRGILRQLVALEPRVELRRPGFLYGAAPLYVVASPDAR